MDIDRAALMQLFLSDSEEDLARLETEVLGLEDRPDDAATVDSVFRIAHTLKGNASILALDVFAGFAHKLEDVLHAARSRQLLITSEITTLILTAVDALRGMLATLRAGQPEDLFKYQQIEGELAACMGGVKESGTPARTVERAPPVASDEPPMAMAANGWGSGLRIEMGKVDHLLDLASRALVVQGQMSAALFKQAGTAELLELQQKGERLLLELQDWVIEARMIPVATFFRSHARTVRDSARAQRKRVRLRVEGERVRVDTEIGESARDVLTHLLRNAIDHGIEPPAVRAAQGKTPEGTITMRASQNGNQVVIQVSDDGAGIDLGKVRARARMLGRADADDLSTQELHQMVFEPGFSTADRVTELSGRGVGMDVVRRSVEDLHGTVDIESAEGKGTTIELRLPLSLSVIDGFWVDVAGTDYVLPLDDVIECLEAAVKRPDEGSNEGIVYVRGEPLAYLHLRDVFEAGGPPRSVEQIVVVRNRSGRVGLGVDAIGGERQTVIRPVGRLFRSIAGISGSTMRPDGTVAFVIDVARLLRSASRRQDETRLAEPRASAVALDA